MPKDFIISVDLNKKKISELRYDQKNGKLKIYLTPKDQDLALDDFEFSSDGEAVSLSKEKTGPHENLKSLKALGLLISRLTYNEKRGVFWSYLKKEELS